MNGKAVSLPPRSADGNFMGADSVQSRFFSYRKTVTRRGLRYLHSLPARGALGEVRVPHLAALNSYNPIT